MRRVGWGILAFFVLLCGAFLAMLRFDTNPAESLPVNQQAQAQGQVAVTQQTARTGTSVVAPKTRVSLPATTVANADMVPIDTLRAPPMRVPVRGADIGALHSNWGDARDDGARAHTGFDIMAERGTPAIAALGGTIEKLYYSEGGGGITLYLRSDDRNWELYYAHLGGYAPGIVEGQHVDAGTVLGYVGDTGNAASGNHHLHFGVSHMAPGERWYQGTPVDPYPLLARGQGGR